jgi:hypothetical protein
MMVSVAALLLIAPLQYGFEPGTRLAYDSIVQFEGFIPLLGGNEGKVVVAMGVAVDGLKPTKEDTVKAANEITQFKVTFNDAVLPLDVASVQSYFPRTTISLKRTGEIVESDAPNVKLPVRLPGLDVKRFPDITYVPVQFPEGEIKVGQSWSFKKKFGDGDIDYKCTVTEQRGDVVLLDVSIKQEYELLEDAALEVVTEERNAERRVKTLMTGNGIVLFDIKRGIVSKAEMVNDAKSDVTRLVDGAKSKRELRTTFSLSLREPKPPTASKPQSGSWLANAWTSVSETAQRAWQSTLGWWTLAKLSFQAKFLRRG